MHPLSKDQAQKITDLKSYCEVTGAKRFKRTKDEVAQGLSPQEALERRLDAARNDDPFKHPQVMPRSTIREGCRPSNGEIVLRMIPAKGTDKDYFEFLPNREIQLEMDERWYMWLDNLAHHYYDNDIEAALQDMMNKAIESGISNPNRTEDSQAVKARS